MNLKGKCVVLGVTGGIAAYKMANVASALRKTGADVNVIMTQNATQFITPLTFETLTNNKCIVDTFDRDFKFEVTHISLAKKADLMLIAPATANVIAKLAHGIADDMLTTVALAATCKKLVAPAMNTAMLENPITQDNIKTLEKYGFGIIPSDSGMLACKDVGSGKLPDPEVLCEYVYQELAAEKDLAGLHITVTAGPTQEPLDPVRYLTNHSTGKMGYAIARAAARRGAEVTLIHGQTALPPVKFTTDVPITTARDMYEAVCDAFESTDVLIMAAAVADYRPATVADNKIKKKDGDMSIPLARTDDILGTLGPRKTHQFICGFSMETENMVENSRGKLARKNMDMIAANNLKTAGAGFAVDTNVLTLISPEGMTELPLMSKDDAADALLNAIAQKLGR
ncbi:MAG: bifunctional phosphopantothenoylcysteine decarboxylase/phosphopantothenate--cysteine ligase CoaBC [Faecalibacterium sp.]|nr:bifunctional phosphopantothenoylcysteine decarboxylase/phosphopantothenate--cysteine ligase CoaBC [Faecalibacterium sp.]